MFVDGNGVVLVRSYVSSQAIEKSALEYRSVQSACLRTRVTWAQSRGGGLLAATAANVIRLRVSLAIAHQNLYANHDTTQCHRDQVLFYEHGMNGG